MYKILALALAALLLPSVAAPAQIATDNHLEGLHAYINAEWAKAVRLDGILRPPRPLLTIRRVMAGEFALKLTRNDYQDWEHQINAIGEKRTVVNATRKFIETPPLQPEPQPVSPLKKGSNLKWYLLGGGVLAAGAGIAIALITSGDDTPPPSQTGALVLTITSF